MREEIMESEDIADAKSLWKNQPIEPIAISLAYLQQKAQKFEKQIGWRNLREYAGGVVGVVVFGYYIWKFPFPLFRTGCVLVIAGALYVVYMLHKRGAPRAVPKEMAFRNCLDFHRRELERQRDLLCSVWKWYLLPLVPGMVVFMVGLYWRAMEQPNAPAHARTIMLKFALAAAGCVIVLVGVGEMNRRAAGKLQLRIDALNQLEKESQ
jgi:uncharacterized membrane protein HdeD (DUF308 family)